MKSPQVLQSFNLTLTASTNRSAINMLPTCWTCCPHAEHSAHILDMLPTCWIFCPHAGHSAHMLDMQPTCWTFCPHAGHAAHMLDMQPTCWTCNPHAGHSAHMLDMLHVPTCWRTGALSKLPFNHLHVLAYMTPSCFQFWQVELPNSNHASKLRKVNSL